jgi:hypothetical protein
MHEPLECLEAQHLASGPSRRDAEPAEDKIANRQPSDGTEDDDGAEPVQCNLVEMIPGSPGGLNEDTRSLVGLVDYPFNAWRLSKQSLFIHDARVRINQ